MSAVKWSGGHEHWVHKGDVKLFMWEKKASPRVPHAGTIFFVHGSSMASQPTFDLSVPGRPHSSVMNWFAERGFDTWTMDNEGYGRSSKHRDINCDISNGADRPVSWALSTQASGAVLLAALIHPVSFTGDHHATDRLGLRGIIEDAEFLGEVLRYDIRKGDALIRADIAHARGVAPLRNGTAIEFSVPSSELRLVAA